MDPFVFMHVRLRLQPPLLVRHSSTVVVVVVVVLVVVVVVVVNIFSRSEIASAANFLFLHAVLKWLHFSLAKKYVVLWHVGSSMHDFLHAARPATWPDDGFRKISPCSVSHAVACFSWIIEMAFADGLVVSHMPPK